MTKPAPKMFAIGSGQWPGLSKITEEAGEVQQVIGKLLGTGGEEEHWDGTNLRTRLTEEVGDVLAACDFVVMLNKLDVAKRREEKLKLFLKWHAESITDCSIVCVNCGGRQIRGEAWMPCYSSLEGVVIWFCSKECLSLAVGGALKEALESP